MSHRRGVWVSALITLVTLATPGCSWMVVRPAPAMDPGVRPVPCTRSVAPPIADTIPAVGLLGIAGLALADASSKGPGEEGSALLGGLVAFVFALPAIPFALSAYSGYTRTADCRAMNRAPLPSPALPPPAP